MPSRAIRLGSRKSSIQLQLRMKCNVFDMSNINAVPSPATGRSTEAIDRYRRLGDGANSRVKAFTRRSGQLSASCFPRR